MLHSARMVYKASETRQPRATVDSRAEVPNMVRRKIGKQMDSVRLKRGIRNATPPAAAAVLAVGECLRPYIIRGADCDRKLVLV